MNFLAESESHLQYLKNLGIPGGIWISVPDFRRFCPSLGVKYSRISRGTSLIAGEDGRKKLFK